MAKVKKRRKIRWGRIFFLLIVLIVVLLSITGGGVYAYFKYSINQVKSMNVVIMGLDKATGSAQRNDALMFVTVVPKSAQVNIVSIPRDSYVSIPCLDNQKDKITHAYVFGKRACTIQAVSKMFAVDEVKKYVMVDFKQTIILIDKIGGVELTPSKTFCQKGTDKKNYCFIKGEKQLIDGQAALAYSRQRKIDSDIYRALRQQEVIMAIINKAKSMDILKLLPLGLELLKMIDTNLNAIELAAFYLMSKKEEFVIKKVEVKGKDGSEYSPGTRAQQYMYIINQSWLEKYREQIQQLLNT